MPARRGILYLLRYFPTLTETFVYREISGLRARGFEVAVGSFGPRADGALQDEAPAVPVLRPPTRPGYLPLLAEVAPVLAARAGREIHAWLRARLRSKDALKALWLAHRARRFERVHVHFAGEAAEWALAARRLHGTPYGLTVHAVDLFKPRASLPEVLAGADAVLTVSEHNREALADLYGVDASVVRCGVPPWPGPPAVPERQPLRVLGVGRWVPKKGFDLLIRAVEDLDREVELRLVSDAPPEVASRRVKVLGLLPQAALRAEIAGAGLCALACREASDGDVDGIPVVLMEALSAGVPVLATRISGLPELVDDAVGWLVPPEDPAALTAALREAADEPAERRARGARGPGRLAERAFTLRDQVEAVAALVDPRR